MSHLQAEAAGAPVLIIASCTDMQKMPKLLRTTGRLDHPIEVGTPNTAERSGMLAFMLRMRGIACDSAAIEAVSRRTEGFDSADLNVLLERAVQALRMQALGVARAPGAPRMLQEHWDAAHKGFQPSAAWEANADGAVDATCAPHSTAVAFSCLPLLPDVYRCFLMSACHETMYRPFE